LQESKPVIISLESTKKTTRKLFPKYWREIDYTSKEFQDWSELSKKEKEQNYIISCLVYYTKSFSLNRNRKRILKLR
jgi:hypothetical protein